MVDTNILVRAVMLDPPAEAEKATELLQSDQIILPPIALCELIWVLAESTDFSDSS